MTETSDLLLNIGDLKIEGRSDGVWHPVVKGVDLTPRRGEIMGLFGESGAGKSTPGLAVMGHVKSGCRIAGGQVRFDARDLVGASTETPRRPRGKRIAHVAQSAAAAFNPAYRPVRQNSEAPVKHGAMSRAEAERDAVQLYREIQLPHPEENGFRYPHQVPGGQLPMPARPENSGSSPTASARSSRVSASAPQDALTPDRENTTMSAPTGGPGAGSDRCQGV